MIHPSETDDIQVRSSVWPMSNRFQCNCVNVTSLGQRRHVLALCDLEYTVKAYKFTTERKQKPFSIIRYACGQHFSEHGRQNWIPIGSFLTISWRHNRRLRAFDINKHHLISLAFCEPRMKKSKDPYQGGALFRYDHRQCKLCLEWSKQGKENLWHT